MRVIRRIRRAFFTLLVVGALAGSAIEATHAEANCTQGSGCDCCLTVDCPGRCWHVCKTDHHECGNHHPGTLCDWGSMEG
jgi:hypothetical protein